MDNQERNREALVEHIAEQDRILRRRNEQIARQAKQIENQARNAEEAQWAIEEQVDRAEQERDEYRAMHSEQMKAIARLQKNPRPLTADDITDEMITRGATAYYATAEGDLSVRTRIRRALTAALTEPTRPEGAEDLSLHVSEALCQSGNPHDIADYLAERGVRVTGKDN